MTYSFDELRRYLDDLPSRFDVPGYDCLIIHKGENVFRHTAGWADRENKIPLTKDHFYNLYSASKPITCAVALHAMEEGRYLLQLPVSYYIPEFKNLTYKHKNEDGSEEIRPVTKPMLVQDLFTMCGGFNYNTKAPAIAELKASNPDFTASDLMKALISAPLDFQPGERYQYSLCHDVLAGFIEEIVGMRFSEYAQKVMFDPLEMEAYWHYTPELDKKMARQYYHDDATGKCKLINVESELTLSKNHDSGGAGIITSVDEYAKFAWAMTNYGLAKNGNRILSKASVNLMRTNLLKGQPLTDFQNWQTGYGYGYGVRTKLDEGRGGNLCPVGEFGWDGAAGFMFVSEPEKELAILYAQHMRNPKNDFIDIPLKNIVNAIIE